MAKKRKITRDDLYLKARMLAEGLSLRILSAPPGMEKLSCIEDHYSSSANTLTCDYSKEGAVTDLLKELGSDFGLENTFLEYSLLLEGSGVPAPLSYNPDSALELVIDGWQGSIREKGNEITTCRIYNSIASEPWAGALLANGMKIADVLPGMSKGIVNYFINLSCYNFNSGQACRYCGLFSSPMSKGNDEISISALAEHAHLQAEAVRLLTDHGWRGAIAVSGGALTPSIRGEYLERMETVINILREALDERTFSELSIVYNHYPPEDFSDMHKWKKIGITGTSIDLEVADPANFEKICPGKSSYRPYKYWRESLDASVEVFGSTIHTTTNIVTGIEPMTVFLERVEELLTNGILPIPLTFQPSPNSYMADARPPTAEWLMEATEKMTNLLARHSLKFAGAIARDTAGFLLNTILPRSMIPEAMRGPDLKSGLVRNMTAIRPNPLLLVPEEITRRLQSIGNLFRVGTE